MTKFSLQLPRPMLVSDDCLPHAAMNLGSFAGGARPAAGLASRLVIESHLSQWVLYRLDAGGGFAGDSWHAALPDAFAQAKKEFGVDFSQIQPSRQS